MMPDKTGDIGIIFNDENSRFNHKSKPATRKFGNSWVQWINPNPCVNPGINVNDTVQ